MLHQLDEEILHTPMPTEYENEKMWILCKDCHAVSKINVYLMSKCFPKFRVLCPEIESMPVNVSPIALLADCRTEHAWCYVKSISCLKKIANRFTCLSPLLRLVTCA